MVAPGDLRLQRALLAESAPPASLVVLRLLAHGGGAAGLLARGLLGPLRRLSPVSETALAEAVRRAEASGAPPWSSVAARRRHELARLAAVWGYVRSRACRRAEILRYFGESRRGGCDACDRCGGVPDLPPAGS
jgi:hypothetical protein